MKKFKTISSIKHSWLDFDIDAHQEVLILEVHDSHRNQPDYVSVPFELAYEYISPFIPDDILFSLDYQAGNVSSVGQTDLTDVFIQIADEGIIKKNIDVFKQILSVSVLDKEEFIRLPYRKQFAHFYAVYNEVEIHNWKQWFSELANYMTGRSRVLDKSLSIIGSNLKWFNSQVTNSWENHFVDIYYDHEECSIHYAQAFHDEMQKVTGVFATELCEFLGIKIKTDEDEIYAEFKRGVFIPIEHIEFTHLELIKYLLTVKLQQA